MKTEAVKTKNTRSLASSLALSFFSLSVVVLLLSSSLQIGLNIRTQQAVISSRQQLIAQEASKTVSNFIQEKYATLETAVEFANPVLASSNTQTNILQSLLGVNPAFRQFAILNKQDRQLAQISRVSQSLSPQFAVQLNSDIVTQTSNDQRFLSPVYIDDVTSEPLIIIAIPVKSALGEFQGTLAAEVNLKFMWDLVDQLQVGNTGYAYVVDNQGTLIAFKDTALVLQGKNVSEIGEVTEFIQNPSALSDITPDVVSYTGLNGGTVVGTYAPIGTLQWAVVTELPWREAYQDVISLVLWSIAIILGIALLASVVGVYGARRSAAPLVELSKVASAVAQGNLGVQAREVGSTELIQLAISFNNMTTQLSDSIGNLEQRVADRTKELASATQQIERRAKQFESISQIARTISSTRDIDSLLVQITAVINREFGFYHVGIFLLDTAREFAVLSAANSDGGRIMLDRGHRLKVGEVGMVGYVTSTGKPRVALDTGADAVFFNNPDLPETRSEIALPLRVGETIIGALDVQSTEPNAFNQEDINILTTLADQVGIAIQNARQYDETRKALVEADTLSKQFIQTGWKRFAQTHEIEGIRHTGAKSTLLYKKSGKGKNEGSLDKTQLKTKGRGATLALPVKLRGEVIGSVDIRSPENRQWDQDELDIVTAIIERAAIALESSRLLEDAQRRASREQAIGEISATISTYTDTEAILRATVNEIAQKIGGAKVVFELGAQTEDGKRSKSQ